ncbi:nucleotidyl transferase AbiEii/AbiGii toxin family protein [Nocardia sp. NPDC052566]|uniref:nucleotidyl transferase AbiEii/AbiGii toxin family protein n=1 Tax=Nocardia sp. NPDC052566 TaxID=3364330 RepID=UPI0037CC4FFA
MNIPDSTPRSRAAAARTPVTGGPEPIAIRTDQRTPLDDPPSPLQVGTDRPIADGTAVPPGPIIVLDPGARHPGGDPNGRAGVANTRAHRGNAADLGAFRGNARTGAGDLTDSAVLNQITENLELIRPDGARWDEAARHFLLRNEHGDPVVVRIAVGPTRDGVVAEFARRTGTSEYDVVISPRARDQDVARAVAHELAEIQLAQDPSVDRDPDNDQPRVLTAHLAGRYAEAKVLVGQLDRSRGNLARTLSLRTDLSDLANALGLLSAVPDQRALLDAHDSTLATRLDEELARPDPSDTQQRPEGAGIHPPETGAFYRRLLDAARTAAQDLARGRSAQIQQFTLQRALARLFSSEHGANWVLKGGQGMLARIPGARTSADIDLVRITEDGTPVDAETLVAEYRQALQREHGDHLRFEYDRHESLQNGGVRVFHIAYLGATTVMEVGVDLNPERGIPMWDPPDTVVFPAEILRTDTMPPTPELPLLSVRDVLLHKIAGMFTMGYHVTPKCGDCEFQPDKNIYTCQRAGSELPYRPQDLADVLLLAMTTPFDGAATQQNLREEIRWREQQGDHLEVPGHFVLPNENWVVWFNQHLGPTDALPFRNLDEAMPLARLFLDPLLSDQDLHAHWDPRQRRWIGEATPPPTEAPAADPVATEPQEGVQRIEGAADAPPSGIFATPDQIARWDGLSADGGRRLDAFLAELVAYVEQTSVTDMVFRLHRELDQVGVAPERISGMDNKHLRFYSHQSGEEHIHSMALTVDPETTIEIAFRPNGVFKSSALNAQLAHIAYLGELPAGMTAEQANAVVFARWAENLPIDGVSHGELIRALFDLHAEPLRAALRIRQRLIQDYGIDPSRIRVAVAEDARDVVYTETRWQRAHLFTLNQIRDLPVAARGAILDAVLGHGDIAENRIARADAVLNRLLTTHEDGDTGPREYTLLWVRDSRPYGTRGAELDTRPAHIRQLIETMRARHPDRRIVLVGDDLFAGRPGMLEMWRRAGVLEGVDTSTLVRFWERDGLSYGEQALFFRRLAGNRNVAQIGLESGALEIPMILGVPTVYLSAREYDGNKANRWNQYFRPVQHGWTLPITTLSGDQVFDPSGLPRSEFHPDGDQRPAPLTTVERVPVGPASTDPLGRPVAVHYHATVSLTATRIIALIESGQLARWTDRLGRSVDADGEAWTPWSPHDWRNSGLYADQLHRWLHTEATTPEQIAVKWDAIRLTLKGIVEPGYTADETYHGVAAIHPYFPFYSEHPAPADIARRLAEAYAAPPQARAAAVVEALQALFDAADIPDQANRDLAAFELAPLELDHVMAALDRVLGQNTGYRPGETSSA